jgi:hypothetical protein
MDVYAPELFGDLGQAAHGPAETVEPGHNQHVACAERAERMGKAWTVVFGAV